MFKLTKDRDKSRKRLHPEFFILAVLLNAYSFMKRKVPKLKESNFFSLLDIINRRKLTSFKSLLFSALPHLIDFMLPDK